MRRILAIIALTFWVNGFAQAGPSGASGPITVDSTTFVAGQSVMGTDGGVYSDGLPPVASTTTAAFRMTKYRAQHVNLRDSSGAELGVSGNPLYTTAVSSVTIGAVTVTNSSFSVTGSTVIVQNSGFAVTNTPNVHITNAPFSVYVATTNVTGSTVTVSNAGFNVNNTPYVHFADPLAAGTNNIGTVTGSTIVVQNTGFAVTNTPSVNINNTPTVTANAGSGIFNTTGSSVVVSGTVSIGNQPTLNTNMQVHNGGGTPTPVGWDNLASSVPVHEAGTANVNVINSPLRVSASIAGSSNTVAIAGTVPVSMVNVTTVTFATNAVNATVVNVATTTISGTPGFVSVNIATVSFANTPQPVTQSGTWNNKDTVVNVATITFNGSAQPVTQSGTWAVNSTAVNVGTVTISGNPVLGAGTNAIGKITFNSPTTTAFSSATINTSSTGDNTIVSGTVAQTVRVFRMFFVVSAATTITFKDGSTALTGAMTFSAGGSFVLDLEGDPWFVTTANNGFVINQSGTAQISGRIYFTQS